MPKKTKEETKITDSKVQGYAEFQTKVKIKPKKPTPTSTNVLKVNNISIKQIKNNTYKHIKKGHTEHHFKVRIKPMKPYEIAIDVADLETGLLRRSTNFVKNHYHKKRALYQVLFLVLNLTVILGILIYQKNTLGVMSVHEFFNLEKNSYLFLLYAALAFLFGMALEAFRTHILIYEATKFNKPVLSMQCAAISRYYDSLIPVFGGKPFELFYLHNHGLKPSVATSVPLAKYLFYLLSTIITSTVVIVTKWSFLQESNHIILFIGTLMLLINMFLVFTVIVFSVSKKVAPKLVLSILLFFEKIHLIKDHREHFFKFMRFVLEYQKSAEYFLKNKFVTVLSLISSLLISLLKAIIPFLIYAVFATPSWSVLLDIMSKYYILTIAINFVPIPGGTGAAELTFAALFMDYFAGGTLFWAILLWRFFSYYLYLLVGLPALFVEYFKNKKQVQKFSDPQPVKNMENDI